MLKDILFYKTYFIDGIVLAMNIDIKLLYYIHHNTCENNTEIIAKKAEGGQVWDLMPKYKNYST